MNARKLLALLVCLALTLSLAAPALAADTDDQALMAVTAKVKETLGLDTEAYDDFQGRAQEDVLLGKRWDLEWNGDGITLSITADDNGKVYSLNRFEYAEATDSDARYGGKLNIPQLPEDRSQQAFAVAQDFLGKVLESGLESVELENTAAPTLQQFSYRFSGTVLLNGLTSPITCFMTVRASDLAIIRFHRNDIYSGYLGGVPDPSTSRTEAQARAQLRTTVTLKAEYVLEPNSKTAVLRYVPQGRDEYYVDGKSGELIDLTELYRLLWAAERGGANKYMFDSMAQEAAMATADSAAGLTQAERDGAAILAGALSKEELDGILKNSWPEMGLEKYTLSASSYSVQEKEIAQGAQRTPDDYTVSCRLTYAKEEGQTIRYKYVSVDAKSGELQSLWSHRSYRGDGKDSYTVSTTFATAQTKAEAAVKAFAGDRFNVMALADSVNASPEGWEHTFTYQHKSGSWFYPGNAYTIGIDGVDGTLSRIDGSFDDEVTLQVPGRVVAEDTALDAYMAAMAVPYGYLEVPVSISLAGSDVMPLLKEAGYSYVNALKAGYVLAQPENGYVVGVYAESGEAIVNTFDVDEPRAVTYDDVDGHWVKTAAEALATFGIGLRGGSLKPDEGLTQLDMVALLLSVDGYPYDPTTADQNETDFLYRYAYSMGLVTPETRNETKAVTRGELVKLILDGAGYERVAALKGIFRCDFADAAYLGDDTIGYAALAQGLGLVKGGSDGAYAPAREVTRAEAIAMLYQYMK